MLNALRHQRRFHLPSPCSCPNSTGAQRLTASTKISPFSESHSIIILWCSTPYGINEDFTRSSGIIETPPTLCSTPYGINEDFTGRLFSMPIMTARCSTPYGINEDFTLCSWDTFRGCRVLNALRHQRRFHSVTTFFIVALILCSTPYGINEDFTFHPRSNEIVKGVLNALRHQRRFHVGLPSHRSSSPGAQRLTASTKISRRYCQATSKELSSAQRLTASTKISP